MKNYRIFVGLVALFLMYGPVRSTAGDGNGRVPGVHAIGNGALCVYGKGADVLQIFGPPYSSPSMLGIQLTDDGYRIESSRIPETAVWEHRMIGSSETEALLTDFISDAGCSFVRCIEARSPVRFRVGNVFKDSYISVYFNDERVQHRKKQVMAPGEMEQIILKKKALEDFDGLKTITVKIEEE